METRKRNYFFQAALMAGLGLLSAGQVMAQTLTPLYSFSGGGGANPQAGLVLSGNTFYGTAELGGSSGDGTVFSVNTDGTGFTPLHDFSGGSDGQFPESTLLLSGNKLYGTAILAGGSSGGTLFSVNTNGTGFTVLHNFTGGSDGANPQSKLFLSGGVLYGATSSGGSFGFLFGGGTVFAVNTDGSDFRTLHSFSYGDDGASPQLGLMASGNILYGTAGAGSLGNGTVFALNTDGTGFTNLYNFTGGNDGASPQAGLVLSGDTMYGGAYAGGSSGNGTVFAVNTDGTGFETLYTFQVTTTNSSGVYTNSDGANPPYGLLLSGNTLYGTTGAGGTLGQGTIFAVNTDGTGFTNFYNFTNGDDGSLPQGGLVLSANTLYGMAEDGGSSGDGTIFGLSGSPSSVTKVVSLSNPSVYGQSGVTFTATVTGQIGTPTGTVQFQTNGVNFGAPVTLSGGGASSAGLSTSLPAGHYELTAAYSGDGNFNPSSGSLSGGQTVNPANSATVVVSSSNPSSYGQSGATFTATVTDNSGGSTGTPTGTVQFQTNGVNFGSPVALSGGSAGSIALPTFLPVGHYTVKAAYSGDANFNSSLSSTITQTNDPASSAVTVVSSSNPSPYGLIGVTFTAIVTGPGPFSPTGTVQFKTNGVNFGSAVALAGGRADSGALPTTLAEGNYTVTAAYSGDTDFSPNSGTLNGGQTVNPAGSGPGQDFANLRSFTGLDDGAFPQGGLVLSGSTLFGTAEQGGSSGDGAVFSVNTDGTGFTTLYSFTNGTDGATPESTLVLSGNTLYGTAFFGGAGFGTVFSINTDGTDFANLYSFTNGTDGANPPAGLVLSGNTLFGTTSTGGAGSVGGVFAINTDGTGFTNLYSFTGGADGANPQCPLILSGNTLFGTTLNGGTNGAGAVFSVTTDGTDFTNLYSFSAPDPDTGTNSDGANPYGGLVLSGTTLFGTANLGGTNADGTVFAVTTNGAGFTTLLSFGSGSSGDFPYAGLVLSGNTLYGTTSQGGNGGGGTVFTVKTNGTSLTALYSFTGGADGNFPVAGLTLVGGTLYGVADGGGSSGKGAIFSISGILPSAMVLASSSPSSVYGQGGVTFTATVTGSGATATGTVQFQTNGVNFGAPVALSSGSASSAALPAHLPTGSYTVTADYSGDENFETNAGTLIGGQTINLADSATAVASSSNPSVFGQGGVTFTATITDISGGSTGTPRAGTVQFQTNGANFGDPVAISGGTATSIALPAHLPTDTYTVTAAYSGDANFNASTSSALTETNNPADSAVTVVSSSNPAVFGQGGVTFTATVSDISSGSTGTPRSGTVQFQTNGANFGDPVAISGGSAASIALPTHLPTGNYTVAASYSGDANFNPSTSEPVTQTNNPANTALLLASSSNPSVYGQTGVTFTATVGDVSGGSSGTPTGTVQFQTNGVNFGGPVTLSSGSATSTALAVGSPVGSYTVIAAYSGDANFSSSGSTLNGGQTVNPATVTPSVTVQSSKPYDGTTVATITGSSLSGYVAGDNASTVNLGSSGSAHYPDPNVGVGKTVTVTNLSLSGSSAGNYVLSSTTATTTATITGAPVTIVSGLTATNKIYDGTNTATLVVTNTVVLSGLVGGDGGVVSLTTNGYVATFANSNATTNITVTVSGLSLTGGDYTNYTLTQPVYSANITPAPVTIASGLTVAGVTYGALSGLDAAALISNNVVLSGVLPQDTNYVELDTNGYAAAFTDTNANATVPVTVLGLSLSGNEATNYTLAQPSLTGDIAKATLEYVATATNRPYGSLNPTFTGYVTNFVAGDTQAGATSGTLVFSSLATPSSPVGFYAINGAGLTASNYVIVQAPGNGNALTITTVTPPDLVLSHSGNTLTVSWPPAQLGWTLQTNSVGLTTPGDWAAWTGSTSVISEMLTIDPTRTNVFFRLVSP